jgi:aryl-alcohol dehydrogenase-like predicted oxidoreductase
MMYRQLGRSGLRVSAIGLGCMGMSQSYGTPDADESIRTIHRALDLGVTLVDTANVYGKGENEELVGRAIRDRRKDVVLATKFGLSMGASAMSAGVDARAELVGPSCDASLARLGVDVIDLYYLHRVDPNVPIEETVGAMADLVREGKVRFLGLSEAGPETLRRATKIHPIAALQSEFSLWSRDPERAVLSACRELGIGFVPFSPLGRGFLTGTVKDTGGLVANDVRRHLPRFQQENISRNVRLVEGLESMARSKGCSAAQLALAWLLHKGDDIVPIPGTKRLRYLEENVEAVNITLTPREMSELDESFQTDAVAGERYGPESLKLVEN